MVACIGACIAGVNAGLVHFTVIHEKSLKNWLNAGRNRGREHKARYQAMDIAVQIPLSRGASRSLFRRLDKHGQSSEISP
jgi:hypothetical protein